jgi:Ca2+-binding EF-hand superfamily protein
MALKACDRGLEITEILPNGPLTRLNCSEADEVRVGDILKAVNGKVVAGDMNSAKEALNGLQGTTVMLTVLRYSLLGPDTISVSVVRGSAMNKEEAPVRMQGRSLAQQTQEQSMRQMEEQAQDIPGGVAEPTSSLPLHSALSRAKAGEGQAGVMLSPERQLADLQKQNAALKKELEKANDKLKANLAASEAASLVQPSDASLQGHFVDWQMFDGCLQTLKQMDDTSLKAEFNQFADICQKEAENENSAAEEASTDALSKCRLSKQGLAALFAAKNRTLSEGEVEELMMRIDTSGDGKVDWQEFRALIRSSSELEMIFKGLPLERVLASCFARGAADDPLQPFFSLQHSDVVAGVLKAGHILVAMVTGLIKKQNDATKARASQDQAAGGAKYGAELKGGTVEKFFEGVTGICGEPNPGVCVWSVCV